MVDDLIATPLGVAAILNMISIEGCSTDASPLILPQPHKGVANYCTHHVARLRGESLHSLCSFAHPLAMLPEPLKGFLHHSWTLPLLLNIELSTTQQFFFSEKQMRFFMLWCKGFICFCKRIRLPFLPQGPMAAGKLVYKMLSEISRHFEERSNQNRTEIPIFPLSCRSYGGTPLAFRRNVIGFSA